MPDPKLAGRLAKARSRGKLSFGQLEGWLEVSKSTLSRRWKTGAFSEEAKHRMLPGLAQLERRIDAGEDVRGAASSRRRGIDGSLQILHEISEDVRTLLKLARKNGRGG